MDSHSKVMLMVEGNIGAGKSTFLKILEKNLNIEAIFEPTKKWQDKDDQNNLLHLFYRDTTRWAYTFQTYAFISRVEAMLEYQNKKFSKNVHVLERSVYCDRYCFAKNCFEAGLMSRIEWQIYKEWFSWLAEKYSPQPNGFIYLRTTPETCLKRMQKRCRSEEKGISLDYLKAIHKRHEAWLISQEEVAPHLINIPVLVLPCDDDFELNLEKQKDHVNAVQKFIDQAEASGKLLTRKNHENMMRNHKGI
jgi:deoxyguanosine kinase